MGRSWPGILFSLVCLGCLLLMLRLVSVHPHVLLTDLVIDDALYFLIPAKNFVAGSGFSFAGGELTSGVQPLWAIVVTLMASLITDDVIVVRALCLLSGLCWLAAGIVLYRALRPWDLGLAFFAAMGWLLLGFWNRLALMGMENGLHGLLFALIIARGTSPGSPRSLYFQLGILTGLFALTRTECGLLVPIMGLLVLWGWGRDCVPPWRNWRGALFFSLLVLVILGSWAVFAIMYFGQAMPISGQVKLFYEESWGDLHGGFLANLFWHLEFIVGAAWWVMGRCLQSFLSLVSGVGEKAVAGYLVAGLLGLGLVILLPRSRQWLQDQRGKVTFPAALILFCLLHWAMVSTLLPHFTGYGTWYFSAEFMVLWALAALAMTGLVGVFRFSKRGPAPLVFLGLLLGLANLPFIYAEPRPDGRMKRFLAAGCWLDQHLAPHKKIGALSAGLVNYCTPSHQVINLDGLMNNQDYLDNYLQKNRFPAYLEDKAIDVFADYQPFSTWRRGLDWFGRVDLSALKLKRWWWMGGEEAYCIWGLEGDPVRENRLARIQFDAMVCGKYPLVEQQQLTTIKPDERVVTSIVNPATGHTRHLVLGETKISSLGLGLEGIFPDKRIGHDYGDYVRLVGADLPGHPLPLTGPLVVTWYWHRGKGKALGALIEEVLLGHLSWAKDKGVQHCLYLGRPCHGTSDFERWQPGELVVETYSLVLPKEILPGRYRLSLKLKQNDKTPLGAGVDLGAVELY